MRLGRQPREQTLASELEPTRTGTAHHLGSRFAPSVCSSSGLGNGIALTGATTSRRVEHIAAPVDEQSSPHAAVPSLLADREPDPGTARSSSIALSCRRYQEPHEYAEPESRRPPESTGRRRRPHACTMRSFVGIIAVAMVSLPGAIRAYQHVVGTHRPNRLSCSPSIHLPVACGELPD